jgi:hypothetical protein
LALFLHIWPFSLKLVGCPHDGGYVIGNLPKALAGYSTRQIEPVAAPTLGADEPAAIVLVVPPESVLPLTDRAGTMLVDQKPAIDPQAGKKVTPIPFRYGSNVAHGLGGSGSGIQWVGLRFS